MMCRGTTIGRRGRLAAAVLSMLFAMQGVLANGTSDADPPAVEDGRSDYRFATALYGKGSCTGFEPKYVQRHDKDKALVVRPGDTLNIFLKSAYFDGLRSSGGWLSPRTAEVAVVMNVAGNAPFVSRSLADYGHVVYYSESVGRREPINASFVASEAIKLDRAQYVAMDLSVIQFDTPNTQFVRSLLSTLVNTGSQLANPAAAPLIGALSRSIAVSDAASGVRTARYRMGFLLGGVESDAIRQPILREGVLVLLTSDRGETGPPFERLRIDHRNGRLFTDAKCTEPLTGADYLVFTIRRNLDLPAAPAHSLAELVNRAVNRNTSVSSAVEEIRTAVADTVVHRRGVDLIDELEATSAPHVRELLQRRFAAMFVCLAAPADVKACDENRLSSPRLLADLEMRAVRRKLMCAGDVEALKARSAGLQVDTAAKAIASASDDVVKWAAAAGEGTPCGTAKASSSPTPAHSPAPAS